MVYVKTNYTADVNGNTYDGILFRFEPEYIPPGWTDIVLPEGHFAVPVFAATKTVANETLYEWKSHKLRCLPPESLGNEPLARVETERRIGEAVSECISQFESFVRELSLIDASKVSDRITEFRRVCMDENKAMRKHGLHAGFTGRLRNLYALFDSVFRDEFGYPV